MAALGIGVTDREKTTVFDSRAGRFNLRGQQKPAYIIEAGIAAEEARKKQSQLCDDYVDGKITLDELELASDQASALYDRHQKLLHEWHLKNSSDDLTDTYIIASKSEEIEK